MGSGLVGGFGDALQQGRRQICNYDFPGRIRPTHAKKEPKSLQLLVVDFAPPPLGHPPSDPSSMA